MRSPILDGMTPALLSLGTALPPHVLDQGDARDLRRHTVLAESADGARGALTHAAPPTRQEDPWTTTS